MHRRSRSQKFARSDWPFVALLAGLLALGATTSSAVAEDPPPESTAPKPWAVGVSDADKDAAFKLFDEGNAAFGQRSYAAALRLYKQAIDHWDHPAIRFNMAECHIHLDQPVEAFDNLERALAFGADPLEASIYDRALTNKKLLEGQLAYLVIENSETGASVTLDGEPLLDAPGKVSRVIRPGRHQMVAKKEGRLTQTEELRLLPGETTTIKVRLLEIGSSPLVRRWSAWKPWVVVGGGALAAAAGVGLQLRARSNIDKYDAYVEDMCANGCTESELPANIRSARDSAELQDVISLSLIGVGAAVVTTGIVMVVLNQPRRSERSPRAAPISLSPVVTPSGASVSLSVRF